MNGLLTLRQVEDLTRLSRSTIERLERAGKFPLRRRVSTRAAASLGVWDLIGVSATDVVLVQCKTRDWPGTAEMETLRDFPAPPDARKLVHRWRDRQRTPDVRAV